MNWSRSRSDGGGEETSSQDQNHHENERRWQQERLHREEAYYQFINDLSDEDYRLMRDHNLLGTPGEITSEELQQRLDGVKEQLASQPDLRNGTNTRDSGVPRESSNEDSLLEWLNTFRRTGNATRSGQNGNQTWRAIGVVQRAECSGVERDGKQKTNKGNIMINFYYQLSSSSVII
ncbi:E3 ubiquitin-protein ligase RNF6 isoform X3 [Eubalaena glacialis]|uniref:E3 ubiquitin-protein ligase RNF6 isoform X3 n=1 Tax=Eubalaena glacialis TaxID=27606 RepID=UPI002A5A0659|nr:E3 ubiquitin-protein ligase RNF6 isoform X3 [Eubalaena glacialis]